MPNGEWPVVGTFSNGGEMIESQLLGDVETLLSPCGARASGRWS